MKVYDTRFFFEHFYSKDKSTLEKTKSEIISTKKRFVSAIVIHEIYHLTLQKEGEEVANLRVNLLEKDFKVVDVNSEIAKASAKLRRKYRIPMADSIVAATAQYLKATCITDDPHIMQIKEIKTSWIM